MNASADRLEFAPPPQPGPVRAFVLAVIAHVLLMLALTWGINWNRESENIAAEAELWSAVPQQAAPQPVEAPPPPPPRPVEQKKVEAPPPPAPTVKEPDIAQEREKKRQELAKQRAEELEKQKKLEAKRKLEDQKRDEQKREQLAAKKAAEERQKQEELAKEAKEKAKQLADAKRAEALRKENLARMQAMAGATGGSTATGTAVRSSGPSDSYAGRIRARVRPNIVFTDDIAGNPTAEVEVRMAPDGTITSSRILKSSGVKSWDNAVLRALDKTEILPRDTDGRVHTPLIIEFKPKG